MTSTKKSSDSVFVIYTDSDPMFLDAAKAMLAQVHTVGGWQGDYAMFHNGLDSNQLQWFIDRGVHVQPVADYTPDVSGMRTTAPLQELRRVQLYKLNVLGSWVRQWKQVVFYDTDMVLMREINTLASLRGIHAKLSPGPGSTLLTKFSMQPSQMLEELLYEYPEVTFEAGCNGGVYAFSTDVIKDDTFDYATAISNKYQKVAHCGEEGIMGLTFLGELQELPACFNFNIVNHIKNNNAPLVPKPVVLHYVGFKSKPWFKGHWFNNLWKFNLSLSDHLDYSKPYEGYDKYGSVVPTIVGRTFLGDFPSVYRPAIMG